MALQLGRFDPHTCNHKLPSIIRNKSYDKNVVEQVPRFLAADNRRRVSLEGNLSPARPATSFPISLDPVSALRPTRAFVNYAMINTVNANFSKFSLRRVKMIYLGRLSSAKFPRNNMILNIMSFSSIK